MVGVFDAGADGWTGEVISREKYSGAQTAKVVQRGDDAPVAEIVLWQRAFPARDVFRDRRVACPHHLADFSACDRRDLVLVHADERWVGGTTEETGERARCFRSATRKQQRIPHSAEDAQALSARNEEAEACQRLAGFAVHAERRQFIQAVSGGNLRHAGVFDLVQRGCELRLHAKEEFSGLHEQA